MKGNCLLLSEGMRTSSQRVAFLTFFAFFLSSEAEFVALCLVYSPVFVVCLLRRCSEPVESGHGTERSAA